jgi:hypothetical protein
MTTDQDQPADAVVAAIGPEPDAVAGVGTAQQTLYAMEVDGEEAMVAEWEWVPIADDAGPKIVTQTVELVCNAHAVVVARLAALREQRALINDLIRADVEAEQVLARAVRSFQ